MNSAFTESTISFTNEPAPGTQITSNPMDWTMSSSSSRAALQSLSIRESPKMFTAPFLSTLSGGSRNSITSSSVFPHASGAGTDAVGIVMRIAIPPRSLSLMARSWSSPMSEAPGESITAMSEGDLDPMVSRPSSDL